MSAWLGIMPLFFGTVGLGLQMGHSIESLQISRDVAHMYAKGIDFSQTGNQNIAVNLASSSGMTLTGGNGTIILSQVITIYQADCDAGNHHSDCTNLGQQVFINKYWSPHAEAKLTARNSPKEARGS